MCAVQILDNALPLTSRTLDSRSTAAHKEQKDIHVIGTNDYNVIPRMHLCDSSFLVSSIYIGFRLRPCRYLDLRSIRDRHKDKVGKYSNISKK
jgi:hypothetical protein